MKVLVACEFSGIVRDAFIKRGHDAMSCDLLPTERPGPHYQGDVLDVLYDDWDMLIAHPPCKYLSLSGVRWLYDPGHEDRWQHMIDGAVFFRRLLKAEHIPKRVIENSQMHGWAQKIVGEKYTQVIQPSDFGHAESKRTCLWQVGVQRLKPTNVIRGPISQSVWRHPPGKDRWKNRSRTFSGIADAFAAQWG